MPSSKPYDLTKDRAFIALKRDVDSLKREVETLKRLASQATGISESIVNTIHRNISNLERWRSDRTNADRALDRRVDALERASST